MLKKTLFAMAVCLAASLSSAAPLIPPKDLSQERYKKLVQELAEKCGPTSAFAMIVAEAYQLENATRDDLLKKAKNYSMYVWGGDYAKQYIIDAALAQKRGISLTDRKNIVDEYSVQVFNVCQQTYAREQGIAMPFIR